MRYIDADNLETVVYELNFERAEKCGITRGEFKLIDSVLFEFPNADVRENVKGKWRKNNLGNGYYQIYCSVCNMTELKKTNFCPNCGADMR